MNILKENFKSILIVVMFVFLASLFFTSNACESKTINGIKYDYHLGSWVSIIHINPDTAEKVIIPDKIQLVEVRELSKEAMKDNFTVKNLVLPKNVYVIGERAFCGCNNLERVTISESTYVFFPGAFMNCSSLKEIIISRNHNGESLKRLIMYREAFDGCNNVKRILVPEGLNSRYKDLRNIIPNHPPIIEYRNNDITDIVKEEQDCVLM